jgi:hypothetical protein
VFLFSDSEVARWEEEEEEASWRKSADSDENTGEIEISYYPMKLI